MWNRKYEPGSFTLSLYFLSFFKLWKNKMRCDFIHVDFWNVEWWTVTPQGKQRMLLISANMTDSAFAQVPQVSTNKRPHMWGMSEPSILASGTGLPESLPTRMPVGTLCAALCNGLCVCPLAPLHGQEHTLPRPRLFQQVPKESHSFNSPHWADYLSELTLPSGAVGFERKDKSHCS